MIKINNGAHLWAELCTTGMGVDSNGDEVSRLSPLGLLAVSHGCTVSFSLIHGGSNDYLKDVAQKEAAETLPTRKFAQAKLDHRKTVTNFLRAWIKAIEAGE